MSLSENSSSETEHEDDEVYPCIDRANVDGFSRCPSCHAQPCVTDAANAQRWWCDTAVEAAPENSAHRKWKYRRFYSMMHPMKLFKHPEYMLKKNREMNVNGIRPGMTKREIMPDCVLLMVRNWFPNPEGKPYVGHTWVNPAARVLA